MESSVGKHCLGLPSKVHCYPNSHYHKNPENKYAPYDINTQTSALESQQIQPESHLTPQPAAIMSSKLQSDLTYDFQAFLPEKIPASTRALNEMLIQKRKEDVDWVKVCIV